MTPSEQLKQLNAIFDRGLIVDVLPTKDAFIREALSRPLNIYGGFDPTNTALHLGHAQNFMVMEDLRKLGHKVFVLFGDFTACIGDPSAQKSARRPLTRAQTIANAKDWINQVRNLMDFDAAVNPPHIVFNSAWLDKLTIAEFLELQSQTTVQRMLERDMFQKRIAENKPVHLHEFSYPLFQAFDSVALNADVEVCGTDQTFNALLGRQFVKTKLGKEKFCLIAQLMNHPVTGEPMMSKSRGIGVFLNTGAETMFGQIMAMPDEMIDRLLRWNTRIPLAEIEALDIVGNPRDAKMFAAVEIVEIFHGTAAAEKARAHFIDTFSKKDFPADAPEISLGKTPAALFDIVKACMPGKSNGEIRRLIAQNAASVNGVKCADERQSWDVSAPLEVKIGKLGFFKVVR
ncbi:MAG: tyrosine--tRNA ligase [Alphaproteobacteria bacterium]|nr:tyrosine--tRNA ligase [Alphaproteobacteria bacterium]